MTKFKVEHNLDQRKQESERIRNKYPERVPVICEKSDRSNVPEIDKKKYLVPGDLTVGQFMYVIRKRLKLPAEQAIFLFINNTIPPAAAILNQVYDEYKDQDGFLYITYSGENTFG
eukprot:CAMPEP_0182427252 /NCGR_PEP_ID=MMETSP1167-20130531/16371_1 /TAXON_ID=2988 /ORGANISM="Mallomonas Sp, Strain CCMP3275" /LENGTH=115 /DNA_ID=CAMNT_0024609365 /DNA_START=94 /DNA_END=441 /DNA_ORIENTATION=+